MIAAVSARRVMVRNVEIIARRLSALRSLSVNVLVCRHPRCPTRGVPLYLALLFTCGLSAQPLTRITDNGNRVDDGWGARLSATSRGKVGFISPATGNAFLFDGANT